MSATRCRITTPSPPSDGLPAGNFSTRNPTALNTAHSPREPQSAEGSALTRRSVILPSFTSPIALLAFRAAPEVRCYIRLCPLLAYAAGWHRSRHVKGASDGVLAF